MKNFPAGANCAVCPLRSAFPPVLAELPVGGADIIFVGEAPGTEEVARRKPFVGASGQLLRSTVDAANNGLDLQVAYTNICACRPANNDSPPEAAVEACAGRLALELKAANASVIVALGNTAIRSFGITDSSTKAAGKQYSTPHGIVEASVHPAYVLRALTHAKAFRINIGRAMQDAAQGGNRQATLPLEVPYLLVNGPDDLPPLRGELVMDIETASPDNMPIHTGQRIRCIVICDGVTVWLVPEHVVYSPWFAARLKKFFASPENKLIGHNIKFDAKFIARQITQALPCAIADTMLMHYSINEEGMQSGGGDIKDGRSRGHSLKLLIQLLFGVEDYGLHGGFDTVEEDVLYKYAAQDGLYTHRLYTKLRPIVQADDNINKLCTDLLFPASLALADVEIGGMRFDSGFSQKAREEIIRCRDIIAEELRCIADDPEYNPGSPKKTAKVLYDHMDLPILALTATGDPATDAATLSALVDHLMFAGEPPDSPRLQFIEKSLEYRSHVKTIGTYFTGMAKHSIEDILSPSFNIHTVITGRLSSSDPNAQNITRAGVIPRDQSRLSDEFIRRHFPTIADSWSTTKPIAPNFGRVIRQQFAPDEGQIILQVDYSQAELRVLCWAAKDENMRQAYAQGQDLHTVTAAAVFGESFTSLDRSIASQATVWKELRTMAKTVNFGIPYGRGATAIAQAIWRLQTIDQKRRKPFAQVEAEAHRFVADWFALRPNVKLWQESTVNQAMRGEPIYTPFGRRRRLSVIPSRKGREFVDVKNHVMNFPIQSIASDCTLTSLIRIHRWLCDKGWWGIHARIIATVHDSIVFSVKPDYAKELAKVVQHIMVQVPLDFLGDYVPFEVDFEYGTRWGNLEKFTA